MNSILDNLEIIKKIDKEGMCEIIEQFPEQCEDAINLSKNWTIPNEVNITSKISVKYEKPRNIIVIGMGGSAIGGNLLKDWLRNKLSTPIEVCRSYHLPAYADEETLVLAVSYSGNTEETISAYFEALEKKCVTLAITSGGLLQKFSEELGVPLLKLPQGYPPRSAIAYLFFPLIYSLEKLKLIHSVNKDIEETVRVIAKLRNEIKLENPLRFNPSKKLAIGLKGSIPLICGFGIYEGVALRMKTQLNENSKTPAKAEFFPELNHNETVGWTNLNGLTRNFSVVLIRDDLEKIEIKTRIDITRSLVFEKGAKRVLEVRAKGKGRLARMFSAMYIGDFASVYLAVLYQINPTPVAMIDELKRRLDDKINKSRELQRRFNRLRED